jgi:hypothetical protein
MAFEPPEQVEDYWCGELPPPLDPWHCVLERWAGIVHRYVEGYVRDGHLTDAPYWYNERANLGALLGAVWKVDGSMVLEEYKVIRRNGVDASAPGTWGRADAWFRVGGREYDVEAKIVWPWTAEAVGKGLAAALDAGCAQALSSEHGDESQRVSITFVVPSTAPTKAKDLDGTLRDMAGAIKSRTDVDLFAWCFPKLARNLTSRLEGKSYGRIFPGVFLVGRLA